MTALSPTDAFVLQHRHDDVRRLALKSGPAGINIMEALTQIEGYQTAERKLPHWASVEGIRWPQRLSLEQCSSQPTAWYKRHLVQRLLQGQGTAFADLTAGLGVDFAAIAPLFRRAVYVEAQPALADLARHNMPLLGLPHAEVTCQTAEDYLQQALPTADTEPPTLDLAFLDPARRDGMGRKVVMLSDCTPDVEQLHVQLLRLARYVLIKLSPMLDITAMLRSLKCVSEVHVVSVGGECKELLALMTLSGGTKTPCTYIANSLQVPAPTPCTYFQNSLQVLSNPSVTCVDLSPSASEAEVAATTAITFTREEEAASPLRLATGIGQYIYEPHAALLKAGAFRLICTRFGVEKLAIDTHLYTSDHLVTAFPGRTYRVVSTSSFARRELRTFLQGINEADLSTRGFPLTTAALRRQLRLREGGDVHLLATTLADGSRRLCRVVRVQAEK